MISITPQNFAIGLIVFFMLIYFLRQLVLKSIFYYIKSEFSFFYNKINPDNYTYFQFVTSGKSMSFAIRLFYDDEYDLDKKLLKKKEMFMFLTVLYFFCLILMVYSIYLINSLNV